MSGPADELHRKIAREVGAKIRCARLNRGIPQKRLAPILGTTQAMISGWETGVKVPTLDSLWVLAAGLGLTAAELLAYECDHRTCGLELDE